MLSNRDTLVETLPEYLAQYQRALEQNLDEHGSLIIEWKDGLIIAESTN